LRSYQPGKCAKRSTVLEQQGRIIEIVNARQRLKTIASAFCEKPAKYARRFTAQIENESKLNSLIHRQLQRDGKVSRDDHK